MRVRDDKEAEIELQILGYLTFKHRHFAWKNPSAGFYDAEKKRFRKHANPYAINGTPDIYCQIKGVPQLRGVVVHFEVKSRSGVQSDAQKLFEHNVKEADGFYFLVRSVEDVETALQSLYYAVGAKPR